MPKGQSHRTETIVRRRIYIAGLSAILGTTLLFVVSLATFGIVGGEYELTFCFAGAFLSTVLLSRPKTPGFKSNLLPAIGVVFITFAFVSGGHMAEQVYSRHVHIDGEAFNMFISATVVISWWLIPLVALFLSRYVRYLDRNST